MSVLRFIVDTQLPPHLTSFLLEKGYDAIHTADLPNRELTGDAEIIAVAVSQDRIVVTKDHDFLNHYLVKGCPPKVLLLETGNISNTVLLDLIEKYLVKLTESFSIGSELIILTQTQIINY